MSLLLSSSHFPRYINHKKGSSFNQKSNKLVLDKGTFANTYSILKLAFFIVHKTLGISHYYTIINKIIWQNYSRLFTSSCIKELLL